jgi:hypothetical protein
VLLALETSNAALPKNVIFKEICRCCLGT